MQSSLDVNPVAEEYFPAVQLLLHTSMEIWRAPEVEKRPASHGVQSEDRPSSLDHLPGLHCLSQVPTAVWPVSGDEAYRPATHAVHCESDVRPVRSDHLPVEHGLQSCTDLSPWSSPYLPMLQSFVHTVNFFPTSSWYLPRGHGVQSPVVLA